MHRGLIALGLLAGMGYCILCDASSPHKVEALPPENSATVSFASGNAVLAGTVLYPEAAGLAPGLVLLTGSGPGFRAELYPIAQRFRDEGYFVLVYDKRGTGESTGRWARGVLEDRASDAAIAVDYLRAYPGVDSDRVGVWGVSQAGWVMPVMARRMQNPPAFMIVVTGGGAGPRESELWSYEGALSHDGFAREEVPEAFALLDQYFEYLATGEGYVELVTAVEQSREAPWYPALNLHRILVSPDSRSQWAWVATHDPAPFIADLSLPVLVLIGTNDLFQPAARAESLWRAGLASGSSISKVAIFENAGHGITIGGHSNELTENRYAEGYWETQAEWLAELNPGHATE